MAGDKITSNRYGKVARFLGAGTVLDRTLDIAKAMRAVMTAGAGGGSDDRAFAFQDVAIKGEPQDAAAYVATARSHFLKREDSQAVSDLDAAPTARCQKRRSPRTARHRPRVHGES